MGWKTIFAKANQNHERSSAVIAHSRTLMLGLIFAGAGGFGLYSDIRHQIHGQPATATLMEHLKSCTVEYQRIGEPERKEQWSCDEAERFQKLVGSNKVKLSHDYIVRVRYPLADGRTREASVDDIKLGTHQLPVGATLPVFYDPANPSDVRPKMSWETIKVPLILLAIGMPCLLLALYAPFMAMFGWAFGGRASHAEEESVPSERLTPALNRVSEPQENSRASSIRNSGSRERSQSQNRPATVVAPRALFGMRNR